MKKINEHIHPKRIPVETPVDAVDEFGKAIFGTFKKEFQNMSFLKCVKPTKLPTKFNKLRYTEWEALEVNIGNYIILTAVCDMTLFGTGLTIIYDKTEKKLKSWQDMYMSRKQFEICPTLVNGTRTAGNGPKVTMQFTNNFQDGKAEIIGKATDKERTLSYNVTLTRVSEPSIVSIPFDGNRPLYSQKDLFSVDGYIEIDGQKIYADENTTAIIDDHKGYYPYKMHYDWVTTMGKNTYDESEKFFGFNLTRNQTTDHDAYNENLIWLQDDSSLLPPVKFTQDSDTLWSIKDENGMVDLKFDIGDRFKMEVHAGIIDIRYHILFGSISGTVKDTEGNEYILDNMIGIGEDKSMRF